MELQHSLFFCFITGASFLSNTAAPTATDSAGLPVYSAAEGQSVSFGFPFTLIGGGKRYLCKEECKHNNIIIETNSAEAQNGSFHLRYDKGLLQVTIKQLKPSDSGRYRVGVVSSSRSELYEEMVEVRVTEAVSRRPGRFTLQSPEIKSLYIQKPFTTSENQKISGTPSTTAATSKPQISLSAFPLIIGSCATVGGILGFVILVYKWNTRSRANGSDTRMTDSEVTYENWGQGSRFEESHYENLNPVTMDQEPLYLTLT